MKKIGSLEEFNNLVSTKKNILIDFSATWCPPCQQLKPVLESLSKDYPDTIYMVDIDENPEIAQQYQVSSIPTMIVIDSGETGQSLVGLQSRDTLVEILDALKGE